MMDNGKTIGEFIAPVLESMEDALWSYENYSPNTPYGFSHESFRAAVKIFMAAMMDRIWALQEEEGMALEDRMAMVEKCGKDVSALVKTFTNIDTKKLYEL
jgi:hypothetical protein